MRSDDEDVHVIHEMWLGHLRIADAALDTLVNILKALSKKCGLRVFSGDELVSVLILLS